ncbi:MAG TPA: hypothetical protein VFO55_13395 [Gemmatimonadaceae bacterium]|nr:hypothetical protein [Gemmatimonadaceae bacterium]
MAGRWGWLRRIRGALGMGLTWAAAWAVFGLMIGVSSILLPGLPWHIYFDVFDAPLPAMAIPGFVGGAIFSVVLGIAARRRRFDELSVPKFAAWGALGGMLLTLVPGVMVGLGLASTEGSSISLWRGMAVVVVPFTLLSSLSAAGSLMLARRAEARRPLVNGDDLAGLGEGEVMPRVQTSDLADTKVRRRL